MSDWHDDDAFWALVAPFLFDEGRWIGTEAEIDFLTDLVASSPGERVLDLGCGPGRHSLEMARRGYKVTGVDRTAVFLEQAREKAEEEDLDVEFVLSDMREFVRPGSFDLALSLWTTFGYFEEAEDNAQVLRNLYDSLREGGMLLLEIMGKEVLARIFRDRNWLEQNGVYLLEERSIVRDWSWVENRWIVLAGEEKITYEFGHWLYSAVEMEQMMHNAGFAAVDIYGDLEGRPYDQNAQRLTVVAWK